MLTGKGLDWGGSLVRTEATGYGAAIFADEMLKARGSSFDGRRWRSPFPANAHPMSIKKAQQLGGIPVTASDSGGYVVETTVARFELLRQIKEVERGRIHEYADRRGGAARYVAGGSVWDVPVAIALPSATQNELDADAAHTLASNGVEVVSEGANMPLLPTPSEMLP